MFQESHNLELPGWEGLSLKHASKFFPLSQVDVGCRALCGVTKGLKRLMKPLL